MYVREDMLPMLQLLLARNGNSTEDTEHYLVSYCYWVCLCMMRTYEKARGSQHVSYQAFLTIAISTISNLVHSIKSHKQDKYPVTSD